MATRGNLPPPFLHSILNICHRRDGDFHKTHDLVGSPYLIVPQSIPTGHRHKFYPKALITITPPSLIITALQPLLQVTGALPPTHLSEISRTMFHSHLYLSIPKFPSRSDQANPPTTNPNAIPHRAHGRERPSADLSRIPTHSRGLLQLQTFHSNPEQGISSLPTPRGPHATRKLPFVHA
jgi:hypothetical protein